MTKSKKQYLGDSVYVDQKHNQLVLTTDNGFGTLSTIYLDPEVQIALVKYIERMVQSCA